MYVGHLFTKYIEDHDEKETGSFELAIEIPDHIFDPSGDKFGLWKKTVATHLASAILDTKVPKEYWHVRVPLKFQTAFNLPEVLPLDIRK